MSDGPAARRQSIGRAVTMEGIGLHLGVPVRLTFRPAATGAGIAFRRMDLPGAPYLAARVENAVLAERRTQLGNGPEAIHTVEHVLAAVAGLEVDDVLIELDAPEPPIMDGSALPFVDALRNAGIVAVGGPVRRLVLEEPIRIVDGDSVYEALPAPALELEVTIAFPHALIGRQQLSMAVTPSAFERELAPARTFGFVHEVEALTARGLIKGASTSNAVVLDERGVVDNAVRWPDEFVRHKALDCVGDLALAGGRVRARIVAEKPSHRGTVQLVRAMSTALARRSECSV